MSRPRSAALFAASVLCAWAAFYFRYIGIVLVFVGALVLLIAEWRRSRPMALLLGVVYAVLAASAPLVWMVRNTHHHGHALGAPLERFGHRVHERLAHRQTGGNVAGHRHRAERAASAPRAHRHRLRRRARRAGVRRQKRPSPSAATAHPARHLRRRVRGLPRGFGVGCCVRCDQQYAIHGSRVRAARRARRVGIRATAGPTQRRIPRPRSEHRGHRVHRVERGVVRIAARSTPPATAWAGTQPRSTTTRRFYTTSRTSTSRFPRSATTRRLSRCSRVDRCNRRWRARSSTRTTRPASSPTSCISSIATARHTSCGSCRTRARISTHPPSSRSNSRCIHSSNTPTERSTTCGRSRARSCS